MRDSVNAWGIPPGTPVVAGYADGLYAWSSVDWALHADAVRLSIAVDPAHQADILDVERYDAVPTDVPGWCDRFNRPGRRAPTIYCNRSSWPACKAAAAGRTVDWWVSTLDGTVDVPGAVAVQFTDVGPYDESVILDGDWAGVPAYPGLQSITAPFTGGSPVTLDAARALIWLFRVMLFGPLTLSEPNAQAAVDGYASRIAGGENPEAVLTELLTVAQRDGRLDPRYRML